MNKSYKQLQYIAIVGNIMYFLWVLRNGIDEGFRGSTVQIVSYIGVLILFVLNIALLYRKK